MGTPLAAANVVEAWLWIRDVAFDRTVPAVEVEMSHRDWCRWLGRGRAASAPLFHCRAAWFSHRLAKTRKPRPCQESRREHCSPSLAALFGSPEPWGEISIFAPLPHAPRDEVAFQCRHGCQQHQQLLKADAYVACPDCCGSRHSLSPASRGYVLGGLDLTYLTKVCLAGDRGVREVLFVFDLFRDCRLISGQRPCVEDGLPSNPAPEHLLRAHRRPTVSRNVLGSSSFHYKPWSLPAHRQRL